MAGPEVSAVVVDNGEETLRACLESLRSQAVPVEIVVAPGPKTDLVLAKRYADKVLPPTEGIGVARVKGILEAGSDFVVCADSDCVYDPMYCQYALEDMERGARAVKAGLILPLDLNPLGVLESAFSLAIPYEFALAVDRREALRAGLLDAAEREGSNPRWDIGWFVQAKLQPVIDFRMSVRARLPTQGAKRFASEYLPSLVLGSSPLLFSSSLVLCSTLPI